MKKALLALALLALVPLAAQSQTLQSPSQPFDPGPANNSVGPVAYNGNLNFYGATPYYVEVSTLADAPVQLFLGSGYLYGVECSSGIAGDYLIAFDTAPGTGGIIQLNVTLLGHALSPNVYSSVLGSTSAASFDCQTGGACSPWAPKHGATRITNGLAAVKHNSLLAPGKSNCLVYALTDAAIKSGQH
jgi:hypothetical protein